MNEVITLRTIFGVFLLYCVFVCASAANAIRSRGSVRYQFNPEIYESIPVAIVYEEKTKQLPVTTTRPFKTTKLVTTKEAVTTMGTEKTTELVTTTKRVLPTESVTTMKPVTTTDPVTTTQQIMQNDLKYNHPPETYQPITVAIVNDEKNNLGAKQFTNSVDNTEITQKTDATSVDLTNKESPTNDSKQEIDDIKETKWRPTSTAGPVTTIPVTTTRPVTTTIPVTTTKQLTTTMEIEKTTKAVTTTKSAMTTEPVTTTQATTTTKPITTTQQTMQNDLSTYQYNHPPETYQQIPVAIVYDEKNNRGEKQFSNSVSSTETTPKTDATSVDSTNKEISRKHFKQEMDDINVTTWRPKSMTGPVITIPVTTTRPLTTTMPVTTTKQLTTTMEIEKTTKAVTTTKSAMTTEPVTTTQATTTTKPITTTQQTMQNDLSTYQYNHPPETYQSIPVAIVYDEKSDRGAIQFDNSVSNTETTHKTDTMSFDSTNKEISIKNFNQEMDDINVTTWRPTNTAGPVTTTIPVTTTKHLTTTIGFEITTKAVTTTERVMTTEPVTRTKATTTTKPITTSQQTMLNNLSRYQYNHPPETYQSIPVAILNDEKSNRRAKQFDNSVSNTETTQKTDATSDDTKKESSKNNLKQEFEDIKVTTWKPPSTTGPKLQNERTTSKPKQFYPTAEQFIPVAIVNNPEPVILKKKIDDESLSTSNVRKKSRKQKQYIDVTAFRQTTKKDDTATISPETMSTSEKISNENQNISEIRYTASANGDVTTPKPLTITYKRVIENQPNKSSRHMKISTTTNAPNKTKKRGEKIPDLLQSGKPSSNVSQESNSNKSKGKRRDKDPVVPILESENHIYAQNGAYHYSYESGDGTKAFSNGVLKEFEDEKTGESVSGGFSYVDREGRGISLTYTADENGYRPVGDHLPTSPPIPPQIARALAYLATKPTDPPEQDTTKPTKKI